MVINSAILLVTILINTVLAIFIYSGIKKNRAIWFYFLLLISVIFWSTPLFFYHYTAKPTQALLLSKTAYVSALISSLFFLYFSLFFPERRTQLRLSINLLLVVPLLLLVFSVYFTDYVVDGFVKFNAERVISFGPGYIFYVLYLIVCFLVGFLALYLKYKRAQLLLKTQIKFIFLGFLITVVFATFFNLFLPTIGNFRYYQVGPMWTLTMVVFVAYAITKHHLFDIKVIATELLVGSVAIVLLFDLLLSKTLLTALVKALILITFVYLGWSLIKSVLQEIKRREEIEKMSWKLQKAYEELKKLDKAKSEFISMASHQLRTPLSAIKGYVSMMIEGSYGGVSESAKTKLQNVFQSNERLIRIVNDLLNISKVELGKMELNKEMVQIEDLIESVCQEFKPKFQEKKLKLIWEKPKTKLPKVEIDSLKIRQVIQNFIDNAIRYTHKGEIEIGAKKIDSKIRVSVRDTGAGLSQEEKNKIFESFTRGAAGMNFWIEGTGLGLYVARKYVGIHEGKVWAESKGRGKGSTFFMELPVK